VLVVPTLAVLTAKALALTAILWAMALGAMCLVLSYYLPIVAQGLRVLAGFVWRNPR
jgi:hypothetical protein